MVVILAVLALVVLVRMASAPRSPRYDTDRERAMADFFHPVAVAERAAQFQLELTIAEMLAKPKPKRITLNDHGPWDMTTLKCLSCGRDDVELHASVLMPKCANHSRGFIAEILSP